MYDACTLKYHNMHHHIKNYQLPEEFSEEGMHMVRVVTVLPKESNHLQCIKNKHLFLHFFILF
ncbi:hypothetical protein MKX01_000784 [Papaver californicum]|nr:hypothetical protein MKX01_000784 [Papaver californicum]